MTASAWFFSTVNYSSVNEDWRTELAALQLDEGNRVLCVTGSGDRPLDLLAAAPVDVVAIDCSPAQNALLRLKAAAIRTLPFHEYVRFIGLRDADAAWREEVAGRLGPSLAPSDRAFWQAHRRHVRRGVIYSGRFERHMRRIARLARLLRPRAIHTLFGFDDIEAQRRFLRERWDRGFWRLTYHLLLSPVVSRMAFGDPAYYAHVAVPVGATIYERMTRVLERHLARDSFMVSLALRGILSDHDLPPYLTAGGCEQISARLDRLAIVDADLVTYLEEAAPAAFTRFSLSDVPSYLDTGGFRRLLCGVLRAAAPGARVVIRQFLTRYDVPADLDGAFKRETELEARLRADDRSIGYDFFIATVGDGHA